MAPTMPPKRRKILEALSRDELLDILDAHQLEVDDRRKRDGLIDRLAAARSVKLDEALSGPAQEATRSAD